MNVAVNGENNDQRATCYSPCTVFWTESSTVSHFAYRIICDSIPFDLSKKSKPFSFVYIFRLRPTLRVSLDGGTINFSRSWEDVRTVSIVISLYGAETTYNIKLYSFLLAVDGCGGKHGCVYTVYNYFLTLLLFDWRCREVSLSLLHPLLSTKWASRPYLKSSQLTSTCYVSAGALHCAFLYIYFLISTRWLLHVLRRW